MGLDEDFSARGIARDLLALGSVPLYVIVIARAVVGEHAGFILQTLLGLLFLVLAGAVHRNPAPHLSRGIMLAVFTSLFYQDLLFTLFAFVLVGMLVGAYRILGRPAEDAAKGALLGVGATGLAVLVAGLLSA